MSSEERNADREAREDRVIALAALTALADPERIAWQQVKTEMLRRSDEDITASATLQ